MLVQEILAFFARLRAPLESVHWSAPWFALALVSYLVEHFGYLWGPKLALVFPKSAPLFKQRVRGLWAAIVAALFAAGTTGDAKNAILGLLSGLFVPALLVAREELRTKGAPPAALVLLAPVLLDCGGKVPPPKLPPTDEPAYQVCLRQVNELANQEADQLCPPDEVQWLECEHRPAIMDRLRENQEACR